VCGKRGGADSTGHPHHLCSPHERNCAIVSRICVPRECDRCDQGALFMQENTRRPNLLGLTRGVLYRSSISPLIRLRVSNRTAKTAKWLGGKLKEFTFTKFHMVLLKF
jgi:hypothetical protein